MFAEEIKKLGEVKAGIYKEVEGIEQLSPSVIEAVRNCTTFLDTAYLWLNQVGYFVQAGGTSEPVPELVDSVPSDAKVIEFPEGGVDGDKATG